MRQVRAFVYDVIAVLAFTAIGHQFHGGAMNDFLRDTVMPFSVGMILGWIAGRLRNFKGSSVQFGLMVWGATIFFGMGIRSLVGGDTPVAFIVVATVVLGLFLVGWRLVSSNLNRTSG